MAKFNGNINGLVFNNEDVGGLKPAKDTEMRQEFDDSGEAADIED
jgi:hypothetical protein